RIPQAVEQIRGCGDRVERREQSRRRGAGGRVARMRIALLRELEQTRALGRRQTQRIRDARERPPRAGDAPALLNPRVPRRAQTGEQRDLLAAKPRRPAPAEAAVQARIARREPFAPSAKKLAEPATPIALSTHTGNFYTRITCRLVPVFYPRNARRDASRRRALQSHEEHSVSNEHRNFVARHYGPRAAAYVESSVHAAGEDLDHIAALVRGRSGARVLDLGCGGGHVSLRAAPHVAEVVACDVSDEMLDAVRRTAADRGVDGIRVKRC